MSGRPLGAVLAGAFAVSTLAGCGGGSSDEPGQTPAPTSSAASPSTSPTASPTPPGDTGSYLPAPDDVELTPPGTELRLRQGAFAAWQPRQDLVGVVGLKVVKVEQTTVKRSLKGFDLDAAAAVSTPYFVSTVVGNGGDTDLGGRQLPLYVVDTDDRLIPPTGVDPGFKACPGSVLPAIFAPGDTTRSCLIFLVPPNAEVVSVMFRPPEGVVPITWTGKVTQLGAKDTKKKGRAASGATGNGATGS